ncbi:hypothetical protein PC128_g5693 [Phytophthora cactorum]|nr:hypothetical protein PC128_g5693 [Phytophthora cactorum]
MGICITHPSNGGRVGPQDRHLCNFTAAEGVASLTIWYERLAHTCPQYLKTMVDKGLVRRMMLTRRQHDVCDACQLDKQKKKSHRKKLDRGLKLPNEVMYADLLIPSKGNGTGFEAVLVLMDSDSRFVMIHMLTCK